jgi:hypothetical protein
MPWRFLPRLGPVANGGFFLRSAVRGPRRRVSQARQSTISSERDSFGHRGSGWKAGDSQRIFAGMRKVRVGMPIVEVTAPDGSKSLWAAAVASGSAVDAVKKMIPPDHVAILTDRRLPIGPQTEGMRRGEVRNVER